MKDLQALLYGASAVAREADLQLFLYAELKAETEIPKIFCKNTEGQNPPAYPPVNTRNLW